jgi:hypothetical protein
MAKVVDQFSDRRHDILVRIAREHPQILNGVKEASIEDPDSLPRTAFAWPETGLFPVHDPKQAVLSKLYAVKQASYVPPHVMERIDKALDLYGVDLAPALEKTAGARDTHVNYLLPQQQRLVFSRPEHAAPVADAIVTQASRLKTASLATAATNFVKTAAQLGLDEDAVPAPIWKYAGLTRCDAGVLLDWVEARAMAAPTLEKRAMYDTIANQIKSTFPANGMFTDRDELIKMAEALERADSFAGITHLYDNRLPNPLETVFNMDKVAGRMLNLAGQEVPLDRIMALPPETIEEILGQDVMEHAKVGDEVEPEQLAALLQTLPGDLQKLLVDHLGAYL